MSTAHVCLRSALTQIFRRSNCGIAASCSVPAFLVPALNRHVRRSFSSGKCRGQEQRPLLPSSPEYIQDAATYVYPPKYTRPPIQSAIVRPNLDARGDIAAWLRAIEPFLPPHLRRETPNSPDMSSTVTTLDFAIILNQAQDASLDIISHLGLVEGRWKAAVWIAKKLAEDGKQSAKPLVQLDPSANVIWPETQFRTLQDLTGNPLHTQRARPSRKLKLTLDQLTSAPDSIGFRQNLKKRALGQLWRSLGSMILVAAERSRTGEDTIMQHVLEIIAFLHHVGFIPDSVYTYRAHEDKYALQQPPTLHLLSSHILTALSDATWNAHEASVKTAKERLNAHYLFGHEIPGSRHKLHVVGLAPELWLELVLWSCLHGGWILDGTAILEQLASNKDDQRWALISWREILQAEQSPKTARSRSWKLFTTSEDASTIAENRARTRKTISGEIVTAFIDGLVNQVRLGVGARGIDPEVLVDSITALKQFLDVNNLSLGSAAWDSIMARLLESCGFVPEKRPEILLRIFRLASGFGAEISADNASATVDTEVPYFFEPTTMPLSLLHRAMRAFVGNGDIKGAMETLMLLQQHTDGNKQKSVQQFFEMLKSTPCLRNGEPFTSQLPPVDFPAFDAKLPIPLLARLLDLATESGMYDLGRWFLFSDDLDGPLIGSDLYSHRNIAASIVRFGTLAEENKLVLEIVQKVGTWNPTFQQHRMPAEILIALFCSQFKLRRWESVRSMQEYVQQSRSFRPRPIILSTFAAELMRTAKDPEAAKLKAQAAFSGLLFAWEDIILNNILNELYCVLSIMSTVNAEWKKYCSQFLAFSSQQGIKLSTADFNQILSGVLDGYGSSRGLDIVEIWCYKPPKTFEPYRAPGGLPTMPQFRRSKSDDYEDRPANIEIVQESGATFTLQGRISPNRQTIWAILRKVQEEVDQRKQQGEDLAFAARVEVRRTLKWAARLLYYLGFDYEDIIRDLGSSLAELAELEVPVAPPIYERDVESPDDDV